MLPAGSSQDWSGGQIIVILRSRAGFFRSGRALRFVSIPGLYVLLSDAISSSLRSKPSRRAGDSTRLYRCGRSDARSRVSRDSHFIAVHAETPALPSDAGQPCTNKDAASKPFRAG